MTCQQSIQMLTAPSHLGGWCCPGSFSPDTVAAPSWRSSEPAVPPDHFVFSLFLTVLQGSVSRKIGCAPRTTGIVFGDQEELTGCLDDEQTNQQNSCLFTNCDLFVLECMGTCHKVMKYSVERGEL